MKTRLQHALELVKQQREEVVTFDEKRGLSFAVGVLETMVAAEKTDARYCSAGECVHCNEDYHCIAKGEIDLDMDHKCMQFKDRVLVDAGDIGDRIYHERVDDGFYNQTRKVS